MEDVEGWQCGLPEGGGVGLPAGDGDQGDGGQGGDGVRRGRLYDPGEGAWLHEAPPVAEAELAVGGEAEGVEPAGHRQGHGVAAPAPHRGHPLRDVDMPGVRWW